MDGLETKILITLGVILSLIILLGVTSRYLTKVADEKGFSDHRKVYVSNFFTVGYIIVVVIVLISIWDVSIQGVSLFISSIFTLLGVAFVAQWSLLSNITASILLFFAYPFKIGDHIRIQDGGENSIEGKIINITLFNIRILTEDGFDVAYPNNLAIQKPIKKIKNEDPHPPSKSLL
ncbi:mechanosensitive ion channel domain-containing protein [Flammeovirga sp. EKP202]|uniref:mechanosensitive ion channel domain-containing protein n=1 Tax=Flammeovirga sp. EKP202 TaxID=2770592 RepID=UPI00165F8568|nr:mechanosensitive ion channel domain-containing protein [Flammeovirga sp. EKP202]MBD0400702.1 mechanosensitive ion channel [Flammeovirga sp. EKP202]